MILKIENKELSQKPNRDFWLIFFVQVKFVILQSLKVTVPMGLKSSKKDNKFAFISPVESLFVQRSDFHNPISIFMCRVSMIMKAVSFHHFHEKAENILILRIFALNFDKLGVMISDIEQMCKEAYEIATYCD